VSFLHIAYHPIYAHPLPEGHRFPMLKYELIPGQLLQEGTITMQNLVAPKRCLEETVLLTHTASYLQQLLCQTLTERQQRVIGFTQSQELTERELIIMQGTIDCALAALQTGVALNVAGGTHHAFADHGEGFCLLNDMAIASNYLLVQGLVKQILIVDLDVHQGNGTAKLFEDEPRVFTFSMHGATNYPFKKERSDLDIGLPNGLTNEAYLDLLYQHLPQLLETVKPDFVFYLAGVDILETDKFGKLGISMQGCKERDRFVFSQLKSRTIPCAVALGGGYSADVNVIVEAHCQTFRLAKDIFELI
jgi:acetoin utilization deacetylase AcuC-like enzyme